MKTVQETIRLTSQRAYGHRVPPESFGTILKQVPTAIRRSVAMGIAGRSAPVGRPPRWLIAASDIRFVDFSGDDDTILHFEAPTLGEAAEELYRQQELWPSRPPPESTGFDLFRTVLRDVGANAEDSDRFDRPLLQRIIRFEPVFERDFEAMIVGSPKSHLVEPPVVLDRKTVETARHLSHETPRPQAARVAGTLDMIRASSRTFALRLDDGQEVPGVLVDGSIDRLADLWRKRVLVLGKAIYRPSGRPLRIDAQEVVASEDASTFWSRIPAAIDRRTPTSELRTPRAERGVDAFFGTWPGDETDDELLTALEALD